MVDITFSTGEDQITIKGDLVFGTDFYDKRRNHFTMEVADGEILTADSGPTICFGTLVIKSVSKTDAAAFRDFIESKMVYTLNSFSISGISGVDLGLGFGKTLTSVNFTEDNTQGVFTFVAPGLYDINFSYRFVRGAS
ncbi:MAG: hypothetical protein M0P92_06615 [Acholeplasmataceae bacterium]|nr:hypothetical protein [Acholeplasmataceae bacterium]